MMPNDNVSATVTPPLTANQRWLADHLLDAIRTEQRLLRDLGRIMQEQRAAIVADDCEALDDATFGIERMLQNLNEAGRRPRLISREFGGVEGAAVTSLAESLGVFPAPQLTAARNDLREAARLVEVEVRTNRALLAAALAKH